MISRSSKEVLVVFDAVMNSNINSYIDIMHISGFNYTVITEGFLKKQLSKNQLNAGWEVISYDDLHGEFSEEEVDYVIDSNSEILKATIRSNRFIEGDHRKNYEGIAKIHLMVVKAFNERIEDYDCVILPDEFSWGAITIRDLALKHGVPTIVDQCGPIHKEGFEFFPSKADHVFLWGEAYKKRFEENGYKNTRVVGSHRFDIYYSGLYKNKTGAIAYYPTRNPGQFPQDVYDYVDREAMKLGYIIVQHHPHDGKSRHPCTEQLICTSKANVSTFSTVLFESMVAGVPAIQILPKEVESPIDYPNGFEKAEEALDFIKKNDLSKQNEWIKKHCVCDGNSTERFVEALKEVCNA